MISKQACRNPLLQFSIGKMKDQKSLYSLDQYFQKKILYEGIVLRLFFILTYSLDFIFECARIEECFRMEPDIPLANAVTALADCCSHSVVKSTAAAGAVLAK